MSWKQSFSVSASFWNKSKAWMFISPLSNDPIVCTQLGENLNLLPCKAAEENKYVVKVSVLIYSVIPARRQLAVQYPWGRCWPGAKVSVDGLQYFYSPLSKARCMVYSCPTDINSWVKKRQILWISECGLEPGTLRSMGRWSFSFKGLTSALHLCAEAKATAGHWHLRDHTSRHLQVSTLSELHCCLEN